MPHLALCNVLSLIHISKSPRYIKTVWGLGYKFTVDEGEKFMSEYHFSQIRYSDRYAVRQMEQLLAQEGIERDGNLDYTVGLYDEDYNLAATGSAFGNTLRCLAVDNRHQGEGLLNQVISHLIDYQYRRGILDLFQMCIRDRWKRFKRR